MKLTRFPIQQNFLRSSMGPNFLNGLHQECSNLVTSSLELAAMEFIPWLVCKPVPFTRHVIEKMDDMVIFHEFMHGDDSFGVIFSKRRVFTNVLRTHQGQGAEGVFACADGTYKLHKQRMAFVEFWHCHNTIRCEAKGIRQALRAVDFHDCQD